MLEVIEREEGVVALHLPIEPLKNTVWVGAGTEMRTSSYQPISLLLNHCVIGPVPCNIKITNLIGGSYICLAYLSWA